jgi:hypothetical protein
LSSDRSDSAKRACIVETLPTPEGSFWLHLVAIAGPNRAEVVLREARVRRAFSFEGALEPRPDADDRQRVLERLRAWARANGWSVEGDVTPCAGPRWRARSADRRLPSARAWTTDGTDRHLRRSRESLSAGQGHKATPSGTASSSSQVPVRKVRPSVTPQRSRCAMPTARPRAPPTHSHERPQWLT